MKKIFAIFVAATAAFGIVSCNKEQIEETVTSSAEGIQLNITVGDLDSSADTKAVKSGWDDGDQINIWYDDNVTQVPDLVIKYDGAGWVTESRATVSGKMPSASGTLKAVFVDVGVSQFSSYEDDSEGFGEPVSQFELPLIGTEVEGVNKPVRTPLTTFVKVPYTYSASVLTTSLQGWDFGLNNVQVVVTGLPEGNWAMMCDHFRSGYGFAYWGADYEFMHKLENRYILPIYKIDGERFMFSFNGNASSFTFTLYNLDTQMKYRYTATGKSLDISGKKLNAVKIPFSKFELERYVVIGGKKWATMNLGATTVAGDPATCFGDYYAWGETEPRYTGLTITKLSYGSVKITFDGWKSDHSEGYSKNDYPSYKLSSLDASHDAATKAMGSEWHTPSSDDFLALYAACGGVGDYIPKDDITAGTTATKAKGIYWCEDFSGVKGVLFSDGTNRLFFPSAGSINGTSYANGSHSGLYWSSKLYLSYTALAKDMFFYSAQINPSGSSDRCFGFSIRPVSD